MAPAGTKDRALQVLMVCMGNICRSPMAQGALEKRLREERLDALVRVDSAGTGEWHVGKPPDRRAVSAAARRGIDIAAQRARVVEPGDFERFDYLLAMDEHNARSLRKRSPTACLGKIRLLLEFAPGLRQREMPDPFYGQPEAFERALDMAELAVDGLLDELRRRLDATT